MDHKTKRKEAVQKRRKLYKKKSSIFSGGLSFIIEKSEARDSLLKSKAEELNEEDYVLF